MIKHYLYTLILLLAITSCQKDDIKEAQEELSANLEEILVTTDEGKSSFILPDADDYANIPQDPKNPITEMKAELGRMLYHDPSFGLNPAKSIGASTYSCASCHFAQGGFAARKAQGIGEGGLGISNISTERARNPYYEIDSIDIQPIKSPSTLNVAYQELMLWNGQFGATGANVGTEAQWTEGTPKAKNNLGFEGVETQAIAGIEVHRLLYDAERIEAYAYKGYFDAAFPDIDETERYSNLTAALAIAAYERTLLPTQAPFQEWLKGNTTAMTEQQLEGAILFFGKAKCIDCHSGPALNAMEFSAIGMNDLHESAEVTFKTTPDNSENKGRGGFTLNEEDDYKFKVPQLYNLSDSPFYGHGASFNDIEDVIRYKNFAAPQNDIVPASQIDPRFQPLVLSNTEIEDLTEFVKYGLRDPDLMRYAPVALASGSCFPNADVLSKYEMDCN